MATMSRNELKEFPALLVERISDRLKNDSNALLEMQQGQFFEEALRSARNIQAGATKLFAKTDQELQGALLPEFSSARTTGLRTERDGWRQRAQSAGSVVSEAESTLQESKAHQRVANILQKLLPLTDGNEAARLSSAVAEHYTKSSLALFQSNLRQFDVTAGVSKIRQAGEHFSNSSGRWDTSVKSMTVIRNGAVVIVAGGAVTIAAPVVFGAAMAATGSVAVSTVGTGLVGGVIGSATGQLSGVSQALERINFM